MKRYIILTFLLGLFAFSATAQNVLFSDDAETAYEIPKKGKNRASFGHLYTGYRIAPEYFTVDPQVWNGEFFVGRRAKYAITRNYAMGWEMEYLHRTLKWNPKGSTFNTYIGEITSFEYRSNALVLSYYNRITFGKVGDNIGKFLDVGVYGAWNFYDKEISYGETGGDWAESTFTITDMAYYDTFFYGVKARLGVHRVVLTADYKFKTDNSSLVFSDATMPQFTIGLELSLYMPKI